MRTDYHTNLVTYTIENTGFLLILVRWFQGLILPEASKPFLSVSSRMSHVWTLVSQVVTDTD